MNAVTPPDLMRKLGRKIEQQKGMQLTRAELDLLVLSGAVRMLEIAAADDGSDPVLPLACAHCDPFIYFMQAIGTGPVKIGFTTKPEARRVSHQSSSHLEYRFIALFHGKMDAERLLHEFYRPEWIRGEWFHPSPRLMRFAEKMGIRP